MPHIHLKKSQDLIGFTIENAKSGDTVKVLMRALYTSDDPEFYTYIEQVSNIFISKAGIPINSVYQFLIVLHPDSSADLHVNDFRVDIEFRAKRDMKQGEVITNRDISDLRKMKFPEITISKTDKVIYCFKVGWRFGLFFDFARPTELDVEKMMLSLGEIYRYLFFYHVYKAIESEAHFNEMMKDGWFPFIELLAGEYKSISDLYKNKFDFENRLEKIVNDFEEAKIKKITEKWWINKTFNDKKPLIIAGINAYLQNNQDGFVNCIKNLWTEIEGILRFQYFSDMGKGDGVKANQLINHIIDMAKKKTESDYSLFMPLPFLDYLKNIVFADFNIEAGDVDLSRNSSSHGVANSQQYTKARALQLILILDQIYFFITG